MTITADEAIKVIHDRFGAHERSRAFHAKGLLCAGKFTATPEAAAMTSAAHLQGQEVPVLARVSNGGGNPKIPDYEQDVRGLAVSFELPGGARTDIVAQSAPKFAFSDPATFMQFVAISKPGIGMALRLPFFLLRHPKLAGSLPENLKALQPPASYASIAYYAVHAFKWTGADGGSRWVRYIWEPLDPQPRLGRGEARRRGRDYLQEEITERLATGDAAWHLELQVAREGENPHDPACEWESDDRIEAGTLTLTALTTDGETSVFDPMRLTDGIDPSDDPILRFRPQAYSRSHELRTS